MNIDWQQLPLAGLGFIVGSFGTLIGAGGGFILVPVMLLLYPEMPPELITSISLAVVFFNAASGSFAYFRLKRIDIVSGLIFAAASVPGAISGAILVQYIDRRTFNLIFGTLMVIISLYLVLRKKRLERIRPMPAAGFQRDITDASGIRHLFSYRLWAGVAASILIGFLSSMLGIGGGIIHVPFMVEALNFPVHLATATSHFVLAIMALAGTIVHFMTGTLQRGISEVIFLSIGVIPGAQLGAFLSRRIGDNFIIKALGGALGFVGLRILIGALIH